MQDHDEVEYELNTSGDSKTIVITIRASSPMSTEDLTQALDFYLSHILNDLEEKMAQH